MDPKFAGELVQSFLPFEGFQDNPGLENTSMSATWPFPAGSALAMLNSHAHNCFLPVQCPLLLKRMSLSRFWGVSHFEGDATPHDTTRTEMNRPLPLHNCYRFYHLISTGTGYAVWHSRHSGGTSSERNRPARGGPRSDSGSRVLCGSRVPVACCPPA